MKKKSYQKHPETNIERIMRGILNELSINYQQEYPIQYKFYYRVYDFAIMHKDIFFLIECDGEYYHGKKYKEEINKKIPKKIKKNIRNDDIKNTIAKKMNIPLIRFWESEILNNREKVKQQIINMVDIDDLH